MRSCRPLVLLCLGTLINDFLITLASLSCNIKTPEITILTISVILQKKFMTKQKDTVTVSEIIEEIMPETKEEPVADKAEEAVPPKE